MAVSKDLQKDKMELAKDEKTLAAEKKDLLAHQKHTTKGKKNLCSCSCGDEKHFVFHQYSKLRTTPSLHGLLFIAGVHASELQNIFRYIFMILHRIIRAIIPREDRRHPSMTHTLLPTGTKFYPKRFNNI